jgi:kinesin family protein 23
MCQTLRTPARRGQENEGPRVTDATRISALDEDQAFAVFVTFVEVYNNTVFDLLDDTPIDPLRPGKIQSKILREDQHHNM